MTDSPGREGAFRELVFRTYRLVLWHLLRKGVKREDAEDLAQETFLAAFRGFERFRGETGVERWLLTIAENRWRNWVRRSRARKRSGREVSLDGASRRGLRAIEAELADDGGPVREILDSEKVAIVREAILELPRQMRHCATLRLLRGMTYAEIAVVLGIPMASVKVQIFRAKKRIQSRLRHDLDELVQDAK